MQPLQFLIQNKRVFMPYVHRYFLWVLGLVFLANLSFAQMSSKTNPVHINADEIKFEKELNKATAIGHVTITKDTSVLTAEKVEAYFSKGAKTQKIDLIKAFKNVKIKAPDHEASGDKGFYDLKTEEVILEGNVTINDHKNIVHGAYGVMNQKTGVTQVLSYNPRDSKKENGNQVSALLVSGE
jgi:lipopolysaccharide export system protein LptA